MSLNNFLEAEYLAGRKHTIQILPGGKIALTRVDWPDSTIPKLTDYSVAQTIGPVVILVPNTMDLETLR